MASDMHAFYRILRPRNGETKNRKSSEWHRATIATSNRPWPLRPILQHYYQKYLFNLLKSFRGQNTCIALVLVRIGTFSSFKLFCRFFPIQEKFVKNVCPAILLLIITNRHWFKNDNIAHEEYSYRLLLKFTAMVTF